MAAHSNILPTVGSLAVEEVPAFPSPYPEREAARETMGPRIRELVDAHFELVWRAVRAFGVSRDDADDVAQQVFVVASRKAERIAVGSERSFLLSTARGVTANYRRSKCRKPEIHDEEALLALVDSAPNAEETIADRQARALLDHVLSLLADDLRTVFVLFELEEMSMPEIAAVIDAPVGTVASRLRRAREEFRGHVKRVQSSPTRAGGGRHG